MRYKFEEKRGNSNGDAHVGPMRIAHIGYAQVMNRHGALSGTQPHNPNGQFTWLRNGRIRTGPNFTFSLLCQTGPTYKCWLGELPLWWELSLLPMHSKRTEEYAKEPLARSLCSIHLNKLHMINCEYFCLPTDCIAVLLCLCNSCCCHAPFPLNTSRDISLEFAFYMAWQARYVAWEPVNSVTGRSFNGQWQSWYTLRQGCSVCMTPCLNFTLHPFWIQLKGLRFEI